MLNESASTLTRQFNTVICRKWQLSVFGALRPLLAGIACLFFLILIPAEAAKMIHVNCTVSGKVDSSIADLVCAEMTSQLAIFYPNSSFQISHVADHKPALNIRVIQATKTGLNISLVWTDELGHISAGQPMGTSVMDHEMTKSMRTSLYNRVITATPMPTSNF